MNFVRTNFIREIEEILHINLDLEYDTISSANLNELNSTTHINLLEHSMNQNRFCDLCRFRHLASATCSFHEHKYFEYFSKYYVHNFVMNTNVNETNLEELLTPWLNRQKRYNLQLFEEQCGFRAVSVNKQRMITQIIQYYTEYYQFTKNLFQEIINNTSVIVTQPTMMTMTTALLTICNTTYNSNLDRLVDSIVLISYFNLYGDNVNYRNLHMAMNRALVLYNSSAQPLAELSELYGGYFDEYIQNSINTGSFSFEDFEEYKTNENNTNTNHKKIDNCTIMADNTPNNDKIDCPICYESFTDTYIITTNCKHDYCVECISKVIESSNTPQCSLCRTKIQSIQSKCVEIHNEMQMKYEK